MIIVEEVLYFLGAVLAGIILGFAVIYVISKIRGKPMFSLGKQTLVATQGVSKESATISVKDQENSIPPKETLEVLLENHKKPVSVSEKPATTPMKVKTAAAPVSKKSAVVPVSEKPTVAPVNEKPAIIPVNKKPAAVPVSEKPATVKEQKLKVNSAIFKELELNFAIATAPWSGELTSFQTVSWEGGNLENEPLLADFQEEITQAYVDIHLANSIVWLSNETGHHSAELDGSYKELCAKIAERLKKVIASPRNVK
jgi:hypothetical protein